jgi:glutamine synthetase
VSDEKIFQSWLRERNIEDVEAFVPDMAGSARGKVIPADKFGSGDMKMPEAIFSQTISGNYIDDNNNLSRRPGHGARSRPHDIATGSLGHRSCGVGVP